jgi:MATE family multidrug resistance protein
MATVIAEYSAAGLGLWLVLQRLPDHRASFRTLLGRTADYLALIQVNRFLMVRTIALLLVLAFFTAQGARQGEVILAANAVLLTFLLVISNGLDGFANAAEAMVGQAVGGSSHQRFLVACRTAARWSLIGSLVLTVVFIAAGHWLIGLLTSIEEVRATARQFLPWLWLLPFTAVWGYLFDGIFIGATRTRDMQNTMLFSALAVFLPAWWLTTGWGNHGLWFALIMLMLARAATMATVFMVRTGNRSWFRHE